MRANLHRGFGVPGRGGDGLADADLDAVNTKDAQERVSPVPLTHVRADNGKLEAKLKPASWNTIRLKSE